MGYRSAINIFLVVLPPKKHLFDIIVSHFVSYSNSQFAGRKVQFIRLFLEFIKILFIFATKS